MSKRSYRRLAALAGAALAVGSMTPAMAALVDADTDAEVEAEDLVTVLPDLDSVTDVVDIGNVAALNGLLFADVENVLSSLTVNVTDVTANVFAPVTANVANVFANVGNVSADVVDVTANVTDVTAIVSDNLNGTTVTVADSLNDVVDVGDITANVLSGDNVLNGILSGGILSGGILSGGLLDGGLLDGGLLGGGLLGGLLGVDADVNVLAAVVGIL